jgi:uncharacterized protein YyaL (SSP411 family)
VEEAQRRYLPRAVLASGDALDSPLWQGREPGRAYVCEGFACKQPASTVDELARQLDELNR